MGSARTTRRLGEGLSPCKKPRRPDTVASEIPANSHMTGTRQRDSCKPLQAFQVRLQAQLYPGARVGGQTEGGLTCARMSKRQEIEAKRRKRWEKKMARCFRSQRHLLRIICRDLQLNKQRCLELRRKKAEEEGRPLDEDDDSTVTRAKPRSLLHPPRLAQMRVTMRNCPQNALSVESLGTVLMFQGVNHIQSSVISPQTI